MTSAKCWSKQGTSIVFYTDGVVEAMNEQGEMFTFERLFEVLDRYQSLPPKDLVHRIMNEVKPSPAARRRATILPSWSCTTANE